VRRTRIVIAEPTRLAIDRPRSRAGEWFDGLIDIGQPDFILVHLTPGNSPRLTQ
jgi:hypothetical protein